MSKSAGKLTYLQFRIPSVELLAGTVIELVAPEAGFIEKLITTVQTAVTTGGTVTVKTGDALATTVAGSVQTIADAATKGTRQTTTTTSGSSTREVAAGARIGIEPSAGFATAGEMAGIVVIRSIDLSPSLPAAALPALG
jgi:hypothetical protein